MSSDSSAGFSSGSSVTAAGASVKYLMGHSDIGVTLNTYTHLGLEDAAEELRRMEEAEAARREQEKLAGKAKDSQKLFNAV